MATTTLSTKPTDADVTRPASPATKTGPSEADINQMLSQLAKLWEPLHPQELAARWNTGKLLNELLGPPTKRQAYGDSVLDKAAKHTGLARTELSRMRWFAHLAPEMDRVLKKYKVRTWSQVKELLPKLMSKKKAGSGSAPNKVSDSLTVRRVMQSIESAVKHLQCLTAGMNDEDRSRLQGVFVTLQSEAARFIDTSV